MELTNIQKTITEIEVPEGISQIVLLGTARRLGFTHKEICVHLGIDTKKHDFLLSIYKQAIRNYRDAEQSELHTNPNEQKTIEIYLRLTADALHIGEPGRNAYFIGFPGAEI